MAKNRSRRGKPKKKKTPKPPPNNEEVVVPVAFPEGFEVERITPDTPGFLRRMRRVEKFKTQLQSGGQDVAELDKVVEFILPHVTSPKTEIEAREALEDLSMRQFEYLLVYLTVGADEESDNDRDEGDTPDPF
jgi:hypothetical protein